MKDRGFIVERGFNKTISPFTEMIEKRGCKHKAPGFVTLVKEFYANMVGVRGKMVCVRGKWISFCREKINEAFNLNEQKDGSKFKKLLKEKEYQKIVDLLINRKGKWKATRKTPHESIVRGSLTEEAKVLFYFISSVLLPSKHLSTMRKNEAILLYALLKGCKINVGKIIENFIMSYYRSKYRGLILHPTTINRLCILGGVNGDWEKEETYPRAFPLTLIGITKGPKNRSRETEIETEEEGDNKENDQVPLESQAQEQ